MVTAGPWRVVWTRGEGCREIAQHLGDAGPVEGDLRRSCLRQRADLLVTRKVTSFGLVSLAVPHEFRSSRVTAVVAAIGGGPHSSLAAQVADRLGRSLEAPALLVTGSRHSGEDAAAETLLAEAGASVPGVPGKVMRADSARGLVAALDPGSLLVVGAPGGSWLQRQFFGPGRHLVVRAPAGALVVRRAPVRCFQVMEEEPLAFGPAMPVGEARRLLRDLTAPVVDEGRLVGLVRRAVLEAAPATGLVGDVAEPPRSVREDATLDQALAEAIGVDPIPVVDGEGRLRGVLRR